MRRRCSSWFLSHERGSGPAAAPRTLDEALDAEVGEGVLEVREGALEAAHLLARHVLEGEDDPAVARGGGAHAVIHLVAVEDHHGARRGRHLEIARGASGLARVQPAPEATRRVLGEPHEDGVARALVVGRVVVVAHVVARFGVEVQRAGVRVLVRAELEIGPHKPAQERAEGLRLGEREEIRPTLRDGEVADAAPLLVAGDVVPVETRLEAFHVLQQPLHHRGGQELGEEQKLVLLPVLALQARLVEGAHGALDLEGDRRQGRGRGGGGVGGGHRRFNLAHVVYSAPMQERRRHLFPFYSPETRRLAALFAIVYFAQGMWYLPNQTLTVVFKDRGLSPSAVANFFLITTIPWMIKPLYGLLSDFVPLFGRRRKSYFVLTTILSAAGGAWLAMFSEHKFWGLALFFTVMGFGLAFSDVLTDALMVEEGRPHGLTGAFQAVQWASITAASVLVGELGGYLAEGRELRLAFGIAACFPVISLIMVFVFIHEPPRPHDAAAFAETRAAIRG